MLLTEWSRRSQSPSLIFADRIGTIISYSLVVCMSFRHLMICRNYRLPNRIGPCPSHLDIVHVQVLLVHANAHQTHINNSPQNAWLCRIQREDFETVLGSKGKPKQTMRAGHPAHPRLGVTIAPSTVIHQLPQRYRSLNTFGFHPSFSSASLSAVSAAFLISPSIRSLALKTLLCR